MSIDYSKLPVSLRGGAQRYIEQGVTPGGFMQAVIRNDLALAIGRTDSNNLAWIRDIVSFWYNEAPGACWGSREKMDAWVERGGAGRGMETPM